MVYRFQECGWDICGGYGEETFHYDSDTLLALVACDTTRDSGKTTLGDANLLPLGEMCICMRNKCNVAIVHGTDYAQTLHLALRHNKRMTKDFASYGFPSVIETKEREVGIVIYKALHLLQGAIGKKNIGDTGHTNLPALAVNLPDLLHGGPVNRGSMGTHILVGQLFASIGGTEGVPVRNGERGTVRG